MSEALDIRAELVKHGPQKSKLAAALGRFWPEVFVVALVLILWAPRLSGPIDLRWDAGVYYILGSSVASGQGYRILSEPGAPEAVQYPPLLPFAVAAAQGVLHGNPDSLVAGCLRKSYFLICIAYALAVFALARRYLDRKFALAATAVCLLHVWAIFLSDLLFAELPFALISVAFVLVGFDQTRWSGTKEFGSFFLAAAGFFLRTAGIVLFAAWISEAFLYRRWLRGSMRLALAVSCIAAWQIHVAHIQRSNEYTRAAYDYQRAAYQNYNVTYFENIALLDPFRPELGRAGWLGMLKRFGANLMITPAQLGEAVSAPQEFWRSAIPIQSIRGHIVARAVVRLAIFVLGLLVISGCVILGRRADWRLLTLICTSILLLCVTPWPEEFHRYLMPLGSFLAIAAALSGQLCYRAVYNRITLRRPIALAIGAVAALGLTAETLTAARFLVAAHRANRDPLAGGAHFFHGNDWIAWEQAVAWIKANAAQNAIVATTAPHQLYLRSGRRAVYPPFTPDSSTANRQLDAVPVNYVLIDELRYRDFSRRYALPVVEQDKSKWRLVYVIDRTKVFENTATPALGERGDAVRFRPLESL